MQTFLPYPEFDRCAAVLDPRRLGKQRVEAFQILRGLTVPGYGWRNHPAVLMWSGHEEALTRYGLVVCDAWREQGFADTVKHKLLAQLGVADERDVREQAALAAAGELPPWLGDADLHRSHRSALVRKDPEWYGPRFPDVPPDLPYVWPVRSPAVVEAERRRAERAARRARRA